MKQQRLELIQEDPMRVNAFFGFLQKPNKVSALAGIMSKKHWVQELIQEETHVFTSTGIIHVKIHLHFDCIQGWRLWVK